MKPTCTNHCHVVISNRVGTASFFWIVYNAGYPGRTHRFYADKPVYPFGFGLSYSKMMHSKPKIGFGAKYVPISRTNETVLADIRSSLRCAPTHCVCTCC